MIFRYYLMIDWIKIRGVKMPVEPYTPIACADYDIYEIAILRHNHLLLEWISEKGEKLRVTVMPRELKIIQGAEYLLFKPVRNNNLNSIDKLRLDRIHSAKIV